MNNFLSGVAAGLGEGPILKVVTALQGFRVFKRGDLMLRSALSDQEAIGELGRGVQLPPEKLMELRFRGMQAIRFEFIVRLMQLKIEIYTLSIYWENGRNFMRLPILQDGNIKLVYASSVRVSGEFADISLVRYTHDRIVKNKVDAELDRMVAVISNFFDGAGVGTA